MDNNGANISTFPVYFFGFVGRGEKNENTNLIIGLKSALETDSEGH